MATEYSAGSARQISVPEDTNSAVVRELISQLNQAELPIVKRFIGTAHAATERIPLGFWRNDAWIKDIFFVNDNAANTLVNAATDISLIKYAAGAIDLAAAGTDIFSVEGFDAGAFPAKTALFGNDFVASTNCTAVTGDSQGFVLKAGELLVLEFINNEGVARNLIAGVTVVMTDQINMFSSHLSPDAQSPERGLDFVPGRTQHVAPGYKPASGQTLAQQPSPLYFSSKTRTS